MRRIFAIPTTSAEILCALILWSLGLWLALPFDTLGSSPTYAVLVYLAPERLWAALLIAVGTTQMCAISARHWAARAVLAGLATMLFTFLGVVPTLGNPVGFSVPTWGSLAVCSAWCCFRLGLVRP